MERLPCRDYELSRDYDNPEIYNIKKLYSRLVDPKYVKCHAELMKKMDNAANYNLNQSIDKCKVSFQKEIKNFNIQEEKEKLWKKIDNVQGNELKREIKKLEDKKKNVISKANKNYKDCKEQAQANHEKEIKKLDLIKSNMELLNKIVIENIDPEVSLSGEIGEAPSI